ncbi:MAG TPA: TolC family protein [bacterium]|mgnify:CR=1 FL=1|nr:TolC family protein [bacterium]HPN45676.1 TolC family protein [bacterium]
MKKILTLLFTFVMTTIGMTETLSLEQCVQLAMANNPDLKKSEFALRQSEISTNKAWSSLSPGVSANASTSNSGPVVSDMQDDWNWSMGASVSQQFYNPGMYSRIKLARRQELSSKYSLGNQEDQLRYTVENIYFQILSSDTLIGVYLANIKLSDEQIRKMSEMVKVGFRRESDLLKSQVQRGSFETQYVREMESLASAKRSLNILMGRDPNFEFDVTPVAVHQVDVPDFETAYTMMLEKNPSVQRIKNQVDVQKVALNISREAYLPSLSGSYSYNKQNGMMGGPSTSSDNVSLRVSMDIFDGFSKHQNIQQSKLSLQEAQLDYEAYLRDMDEELSNRYKSLETQNKLIAIHETSLASARQDYKVVSQQYAAGLSSILDLMDSQVSLLQSETNLLNDLYTRKQIEANIRRICGI